MASPKQLTDHKGNIYYRVQVSDGRGRRVCRDFHPSPTWSRKTTQKELNKFAAQLENDLKAGRLLTQKERKEQARRERIEAAKVQTLRQYVEAVWLPEKAVSSSKNSMLAYRQALDNHIYPALGDFLLVDISPTQITALFLKLQKKYAPATLNQIKTILNMVFEAAMQDDIVEYSPMLKARFPKPRKELQEDEQPKSYTASETRQILQAIAQEPLLWQALVLLMASTGIRRGEAAGLQWDCVDLASGEIVIKRNLQYEKGGTYITTPKNGKERIVQAPPDVLELLRKLRAEQPVTVRWCFTKRNSPDPISPCNITKHFALIGKKYNIPDFHPHKLRHTFASLAIEQGADVAAVSKALGHSNTQVTLQIYTHSNQAAAKRAAALVWDAVHTSAIQEKKA